MTRNSSIDNFSNFTGVCCFGFNGKESDSEGMGGGLSTYDYGFRIYNPSLGKFLSVDPLYFDFAMLTPYQYASNNPIQNIDLDGCEGKPAEPVKPGSLVLTTPTDKVDVQTAPTELFYRDPNPPRKCPPNDTLKSDVAYDNSVEAGKEIIAPIENLYSLFTGHNFNNEEVNRYVSGVFVLIDFGGLGTFGRAMSKELKLVSKYFKYSDEVKHLIKSTGKVAEDTREIITQTTTNLRTDALKVAKSMAKMGDETLPLYGKSTEKYPNAKEIVTGWKSADKNIEIRIDWDETKGAHYNWKSKTSGESGAVLFDGSKEQVDYLKQSLTGTY